jgi:hypothetical protein
MQSNKNGDFKFILVYQDHFTKFVSLRSLKTKTASEVAYNLIDIFCIFGAHAYYNQTLVESLLIIL